jgi:predicted phosphodiesterase
MKIALISDIHANLEALEAVFQDIEKQDVDGTICLGDVIGYGCNPNECFDLVNTKCRQTLMGNHEYIAMGLLEGHQLNEVAMESSEWTRKQLSDNTMSSLADLELDARIEGAYLVHASPDEPSDWHYILKPPHAESAFKSFDENICFFGHSHLPMIFSLSPNGRLSGKNGHDFDPDPDCRYLVNVGSVGQPRDRDPRACYVVYDSSIGEVCYRRVEYDIEFAQKKMTEAKLPDMLIERLAAGR